MYERPLRQAAPQQWEGMFNGRNGPFAKLCKGGYLRLADLGAQGSMWVSIC